MRKPIPILLCGTLFLAGCASLSGNPERSVPTASELASLKPYFAPDVIAIYNAKATDAEKRAYRDEVVSARIRAIDLNHSEFIGAISEDSKKLNIGAESAILLLGAAGAVSTVSGTQAILSATSSTVSGVKTSLDKNAYYDSTLVALVSQMRAGRGEVLLGIHTGLALGVDRYPLMKALIDVESYYQAGTILGAVGEITKTAGEKKARADKAIADIVRGSYVKDTAGDRIRAFWKPDGKTIDKGNEGQLKAWMKKNGLGATSLTLFLRARHFSDARAKAIEEVPIP
nr:MAG: hypothetical protein BECKDK2373B_GA0170837_10046 [Candidatus Kentron sp. DK]